MHIATVQVPECTFVCVYLSVCVCVCIISALSSVRTFSNFCIESTSGFTLFFELQGCLRLRFLLPLVELCVSCPAACPTFGCTEATAVFFLQLFLLSSLPPTTLDSPLLLVALSLVRLHKPSRQDKQTDLALGSIDI